MGIKIEHNFYYEILYELYTNKQINKITNNNYIKMKMKQTNNTNNNNNKHIHQHMQQQQHVWFSSELKTQHKMIHKKH